MLIAVLGINLDLVTVLQQEQQRKGDAVRGFTRMMERRWKKFKLKPTRGLHY